MPKDARKKPPKGKHPGRCGSRAIENCSEGKLISPQGKTAEGQRAAIRSSAKVRGWNAREDGCMAGRAKSLERLNPWEQRIVRVVIPADGCRILRGSKAQKSNRMCLAANLFVRLHMPKRYVGKGRE